MSDGRLTVASWDKVLAECPRCGDLVDLSSTRES